MQQWRVISGVCRTEGAEGHPVYGVAAVLADGTEWIWEDVDPDPVAAQRLCDRLQALQPEDCHFRDLILDYIEEMAAKV